MMNARQIGQRIQLPESTLPEELVELQDLAAKYPYTQVFSILFLMGLGRSNDLRFEEELLKHSYRIGDRVQLYELIRMQETHGHSTSIEEAKEQELTHPKETIAEIVEIAPLPTLSVEVLPEPEELELAEVERPTIALEEVVALPEEIKDSAVESPELETEVALEQENRAHEVEEQEVQKEEVAIQMIVEAPTPTEPSSEDHIEEPTLIEEKEELDPLEATILQHAVSAGYRLDDLSEEEIAQLEKRDHKIVPDEPIQLRPILPEVEVDGRQSFSSWLGANKNYVPDEKEDESAIRALVNDFSDFDPSKNLYGEVEKPKQEFFSPTKKARESLREDDLPVSETLAKIYVMQGNYPKAIESYTQLSLKYPEKKIFFANLIAELAQKLNIK